MNELAPPTPASIRTLKDLSAAFLAHEADRRFSSCTLRNHRCTLNAFVGWLFARGVRTADLLLKEHLELWIRHLNAHRTRRGQPLQPQSLNLHILATKRFLAYLTVRGFVPGHLPNALQCVKAPSLLPQSVLTHAQVRAFLLGLQTGTLEGCRNRAMLELLYSSGLRASELLGMDILNVNLAHALATVTGKGKKQRVVPFGRTALRCLESYMKAIRPFMLRCSEEQALFLDRHGRRLGYHALSQIIKACARRSGLAGAHVTAHTFRRSCATELLRGGANMYHVKDLLGHESLTTLRHYARLTIVDLKKTHERCHPREQDEV
jgi:integrase/recombinase XerD